MNVLTITTILLSVIDVTFSNDGIEDFSVYNYHTRVGIPRANKIRKWEESLNNSERQRIVGGSITHIAEVPYQVGLIIRILNIVISFCGGSLVSKNTIITAAHCYFDGNVTADDLISVLGSSMIFSGGLRILTNDVVVHLDYDPETITNDIAIVKIPDVTFSDTIQPIALPSNEESTESFAGLIGTASGYGIYADEFEITITQSLYSVEMEIISNKDCSATYGPYITETSICTSGGNGKGTCGGDSGGPLVVFTGNRNILIGVTSFGTTECELEYPSAYTRVSSFVKWIESAVDLK